MLQHSYQDLAEGGAAPATASTYTLADDDRGNDEELTSAATEAGQPRRVPQLYLHGAEGRLQDETRRG